MKILVTGGAGFIASHVVDSFVQAGHQVVIVDNLSSGRRENLNPKATFYQLDIRSPELAQVFEQEHPDVVDHHAAQIDVRRSVAEPVYDAEVNILGTLNLIQNAVKHEVKKFIYISSGGAAYGEPEYLPCDENHPIKPMSPYGVTKHTIEHYLYLYQQNYGLRHLILRYANVYGPRQDPHGEAGVVAIFGKRMLKGEPITINGDGKQERDFVYVGDCARANLIGLERGEGIYNLGMGIATSINEVFQCLKKLTGYKQEPVYGPAKMGDIFRIYLDASKARRELGWEPVVSLEDGLGRTLDHLQ
jgi:UDP-glucose 4-epimerase